MIWRTKKRTFDLAAPVVMGIVNVTLDSFSDGGKYLEPREAVEAAIHMARAGADIIDIGGESTRPGAQPVDDQEEMARVCPVIWKLQEYISCAISIDTYKPEVAAAAIDAGAEIINDITGLRDPGMAALAASTGAAVIIGHIQGEPPTMQNAPQYQDVVREIRDFFLQTYSRALACGMAPQQIAFDPGIGFGKSVEHNLAILRHVADLRVHDRPLVLGTSRKGFLAKVTGTAEIADRLAPTIATTALARASGVNIFRVHDVPENVRALKITEAILNAPQPG